MAKKNNGTRSLIGAKRFTRNGLLVHGDFEIVYFIVKPSNLSVMSDANVYAKINALTHLLSGQTELEILCADARESFEANKRYLDKRMGEEKNRKILRLLAADKTFLDNIQLQMSTAREFMFAVRIKSGTEEQSFASLNRIERSITNHGFECKRAGKKDIKRFLTRYFGWNVPDEYIDDFDGSRAIKKWVLE